jgi:hypothetical protein
MSLIRRCSTSPSGLVVFHPQMFELWNFADGVNDQLGRPLEKAVTMTCTAEPNTLSFSATLSHARPYSTLSTLV